jgi:hypothetical protein
LKHWRLFRSWQIAGLLIPKAIGGSRPFSNDGLFSADPPLEYAAGHRSIAA